MLITLEIEKYFKKAIDIIKCKAKLNLSAFKLKTLMSKNQ